MIDCKGVHQLVASGEEQELGFMKKMELKIHMMMCKHCRGYSDQIRAMGEAIRELCQDRPGDDELCNKLEKEVLDSTGPDGDGP